MRQLQLFIKVGSNRYAIVQTPIKDQDLYVWDEALQRIRLYKKALK